MDVQCRDVSPGAATEVLMLDMRAWTATLRGVFAGASLNAGLFISGDDEFVILQRPALPLSAVEIQYAAGLGGKVLVAREYPTAVVPPSNGVFMEPAPQHAAAERGNQTTLLDLLNQITGAPARQRQTILGRQFTCQRFSLNDGIWGKKSGGDPDERVLPDWEAVGKKALAPERDYFTASVQTRGDVVVGHAFGSVQNHLGTLDLKVRQRIFSCPPAQLGFLGRREAILNGLDLAWPRTSPPRWHAMGLISRPNIR